MSRIILPRQYDAHVHHGMSGRFTLVKSKSDQFGEPIPGTEQVYRCGKNNHLTDVFLNNVGALPIGWPGAFDNCRVGTGTTPPEDTDTALENQIAQTSVPIGGGSWQSNKYGFTRQITTLPYYYTYWIGFRFNTGVAAGNLTEIGLFQQSPDNRASCRALITDEVGNPITLTILSDEILEVRYELNVHIPTDDVTGTVSIKGVPYGFIMRPCSIGRITDGYRTGWPTRQTWQTMGPRARLVTGLNSSGTLCAVRRDGVLGAMTANPMDGGTPNARGADSILEPDPAYVEDSFELYQRAQWGLGVGNDPELNMLTMSNGFGSFQIYFNGDTFSKDATELMRFTLKTTWGRV